VFAGAAFATLAGRKPPEVPPESLQVEEVLRDVAMPGEAERVRGIYRKHLKLGSLLAVVRWLDAWQWWNQRYETARCQMRGGDDFDTSTLQKTCTPTRLATTRATTCQNL